MSINHVDLNSLTYLLGKRLPSFRLMIDQLLQLGRPVTIVETGTARQPYNWAGDGQSTLIFDKVAEQTNGQLFSIDIDAKASGYAMTLVSQHTMFCVGDGVDSILSMPTKDIDLLYLDSLDLTWEQPHAAALQALMELTAAYAKVRSGGLIAVDDNTTVDGKLVGKGMYVAEFMRRANATLLHDGYQLIWRKP